MSPPYSAGAVHGITSEVMGPAPRSPYHVIMQRKALVDHTALPVGSAASPGRARLVAAGVLLAFTVYSLWVVAGHGYTGFLALAWREPWGMQMLLDLVIACSFGIGWMIADAKKHAVTPWPFVVTTIFLGSIGLLGYVVVRGLTRRAM
jgi:hypothetical protein